MIDVEGFSAAVGGRLAHVTLTANIPGIQASGLLPASELARRSGTPAGALVLRDKRQQCGPAVLNHQLPILHGMRAAERMLEGHSPASWSEMLDQRVFFWPSRVNVAFAKSLARDQAQSVLYLDARKIAQHCGDRLFLSPINSGNFKQGGAQARRGDWLFVPLEEGLEAFRSNRMRRGLKKTADSIREISILGAIPEDILRDCALPPQEQAA